MYDVIVVGGGPAGYVGAIRGAQLGLKVLLIEKDLVGGTCLNRGCVPTKALLHASELYKNMDVASEFGVYSEARSFDWDKVYEVKENISGKLRDGVKGLVEANGIDFVEGFGNVKADKTVEVNGEIYQGKNILIATGSVPAKPSIEGIDLAGVGNSDDFLANPPKDTDSLVIIGGGVIGLEFATIFNNFGVEVTVLGSRANVVRTMDREISRSVKQNLQAQGIKIETSAYAQKIEEVDGRLKVTYKVKEKEEFSVICDRVLVCTGRRASYEGDLELENDRGMIIVDDKFMTSQENVYAAGDVIGGAQLAHSASSEACCVMETIAGVEWSENPYIVPSGVYVQPEIGAVGITEEEAKERKKSEGKGYIVGKYVTSGNSKSMINNDPRGFIKVIFDEESRVLLGAHFYCDRATDLVGEATLAIVNELTIEDILEGMRAHPTIYEAYGEAVQMAAAGQAIHVAPRKKR